MAPKPLGIFVSDVHIEHRPSWRSAEKDWFGAMARQFEELATIADKMKVPIVYTGDIFTNWYAGPELINFAIKHLPQGYAIRGNHDLPNHRHEEMERSAYHTLSEAGVITDLLEPKHELGVVLHPFPWGAEIKPPDPYFLSYPMFKDSLQVAVIHRYIWQDGSSHAGVKDTDKVDANRKRVEGYDASFWGDNHKGFINGNLMNCGSFFRRHSDEVDYRPMVGILFDDKSIQPHYLDVSQDLHIDTSYKPINVNDLYGDSASAVVSNFNLLGSDQLDFKAAIQRKLTQLNPNANVTTFVLESIKHDTKPQ